jgi:Tripartite tricarboxylate transporter family receptor
VRAAGDGYTLLLAAVPNAVNATLYDKLNFNFIQDIAPVAGIIRAANVLEVHPSVPAKSVPDFIAYAKSNPGKLNMGSGGFGTGQHVIGELFKMMTGVDMLHVPYRGSAAALTDLLGGQIQVMFDNIPSSIEYIRAGKLRALAVTTKVRSEALPEVPMVGDFVPGFEVDLIELNGDDLRREPLEVRKATLASVLAKAAPGLRLNEHIEADGPTVFAHACKMGLRASCPSARRRATAPAAHPTGSSRRTRLAPRCSQKLLPPA